MGIYDRDYYRQDPRRSFGSFRIESVTVWLIVINLAVFVIDGLLKRAGAPSTDDFSDFYYEMSRNLHGANLYELSMGPLEKWGYFSVQKGIYQMQFWRLITFQFLHSGPSHLFWNMVGLYFFGPIVESYLTRQRFIVFYLLCGTAGAVSCIMLWGMHLLVGDAAVPMVGASAGIFGVLLAAGTVAPGMTITMWFPPITMELRVFAWIMVAIAAYTVLNSGHNSGGEAAHLGGAVLGYALISRPHLLNWAAPGRVKRRPARRMQKDWSKDMNR